MKEAVWGDNMGDNLSILLAALLSGSLIGGCSAADSFTLYKSTRGGISQADFGDCRTSPYTGRNSFDPTGLNFEIEYSEYFGKPIVFDHLRSLAHTSGWATWLYIRGMGIDVKKIKEETQASCHFFAFLGSPSVDAQQNWKSITNSNDVDGRLLGLYTTLIERQEQGSSRFIHQQILVREDSHRWTLLHELSHSLFAAEKIKVPYFYFDHELQSQLGSLSQKIIELKKIIEIGDGNENKALALVELWEEFFNISHQLHVRAPLEEFAIESMLLQQYMNGQLSLIDERIEPLNAVAYMNHNARDVIKRYNQMIENNIEFTDTYFDEKWTTAQKHSDSLIDRMSKQLQFIDTKLNIAKEFQFNRRQSTENQLTHILLEQGHRLFLPHVAPHFDQKLDKEHGAIYDELF